MLHTTPFLPAKLVLSAVSNSPGQKTKTMHIRNFVSSERLIYQSKAEHGANVDNHWYQTPTSCGLDTEVRNDIACLTRGLQLGWQHLQREGILGGKKIGEK
jgi:hypothetical protein